MRPLRRLEPRCQAIADGQYDVTMPEPAADEIGQLTDHFPAHARCLAPTNWRNQSQNMLHAVADYAYTMGIVDQSGRQTVLDQHGVRSG